MTTPDWMYRSFFGNSLRDWTVAGGSALLAIAAVVLLRQLVLRRLATVASRTATLVDDALVEIAQSISNAYAGILILCVAGLWLDFSPHIRESLRLGAVIFAVLQGARSGTSIVSWWLGHYSRSRSELDRTTITAIGIAAKLLVWITLLLVGADNLGLKITGILGALGIGGIAVALALQSILGDVFAALSIVLDKPFVVGDSIAVDSFEGRVDHISLKSTRVMSVNGEQVVFANADLLKSRVRNLSRREAYRMVFTVSVDPSTNAALLARVPTIMAEVVGAEKRATIRYSYLTGTGPRGFDVETAIMIPQPYDRAQDIRQAILLEFYSRLEREGISLARPPVPGTVTPP